MDRRRRSFQVEIATIESHHLVNARDAELMKGCAVVLPNIDRLSVFLCDQHAHQIRSLAHREIFSGGYIFATVILAVPLRYQGVRADCELVQFGFLMQNAHEFPIPIVNTQADCAFERRRYEVDACVSRRRR